MLIGGFEVRVFFNIIGKLLWSFMKSSCLEPLVWIKPKELLVYYFNNSLRTA